MEPNLKYIQASSSIPWDSRAVVRDLLTGRPKWVLRHELHTGPIFTLAYSRDGQQLLTGGADSFARIWDMSTGEEIQRFQHPTAAVARYSPDESMIITAGPNRNAQLWNVSTGLPFGPPLRHPAF